MTKESRVAALELITQKNPKHHHVSWFGSRCNNSTYYLLQWTDIVGNSNYPYINAIVNDDGECVYYSSRIRPNPPLISTAEDETEQFLVKIDNKINEWLKELNDSYKIKLPPKITLTIQQLNDDINNNPDGYPKEKLLNFLSYLIDLGCDATNQYQYHFKNIKELTEKLDEQQN